MFIRLSLGPVVLEPLNFIRLHQAVYGDPRLILGSSLGLSGPHWDLIVLFVGLVVSDWTPEKMFYLWNSVVLCVCVFVVDCVVSVR